MASRLLGRHRAKVLATDDTWRRALGPDILAPCRDELSSRELTLVDEIALTDLRNGWRGASALLEREGVDFSDTPLPAMLSFVERYLREDLELVRIRIARLTGADIASSEPRTDALDDDEWAVRLTQCGLQTSKRRVGVALAPAHRAGDASSDASYRASDFAQAAALAAARARPNMPSASETSCSETLRGDRKRTTLRSTPHLIISRPSSRAESSTR